jgi:predicted ferric reductase
MAASPAAPTLGAMSCKTAGKTLGFPIMDLGTYTNAIKDRELLGSKGSVF